MFRALPPIAAVSLPFEVEPNASGALAFASVFVSF